MFFLGTSRDVKNSFGGGVSFEVFMGYVGLLHFIVVWIVMWYKIPADSKQLTYLIHTYVFCFFFQDNFYQKKSVRSALQKSKRICYPVSRKLSRGIIGYLGPLIQRVDSLEKAQMLGKIEGKRRKGWQRIRWLDGITDWIWANFGRQWRTGKPDVLQSTDTT